MDKVVVVGIGADGMTGLSAQARQELIGATTIFGSPRQLELLDASVRAARREWPTPMLPALPALLNDAPGVVHVVASGDPIPAAVVHDSPSWNSSAEPLSGAAMVLPRGGRLRRPPMWTRSM